MSRRFKKTKFKWKINYGIKTVFVSISEDNDRQNKLNFPEKNVVVLWSKCKSDQYHMSKYVDVLCYASSENETSTDIRYA